MVSCEHRVRVKHGHDRHGKKLRWKCKSCGVTFFSNEPRPLGDVRVSYEKVKDAIHYRLNGMSVRNAAAMVGITADTLCNLILFIGTSCKRFLERNADYFAYDPEVVRRFIIHSKTPHHRAAIIALVVAWHYYCVKQIGGRTLAMSLNLASHPWSWDELLKAIALPSDELNADGLLQAAYTIAEEISASNKEQLLGPVWEAVHTAWSKGLRTHAAIKRTVKEQLKDHWRSTSSYGTLSLDGMKASFGFEVLDEVSFEEMLEC